MADQRTSLRELALLFTRLGATAFGGPAAHIAMMQDEVVRRRGWLSAEHFLDLLGATNLIPGPNSTELALHIGYERRRLPGLLVAGISFIVPAMSITAALAWAYVRFGSLPESSWLLYGVKPVIVAIVAQALWSLVPTAARCWPLRILGVAAATCSALGVNELLVLFGSAAAAALTRGLFARSQRGRLLRALVPLVPCAGGAAAAGACSVTQWGLFAIFFKIGSVLFGSGYVLLAFLRADLVERLHWLTPSQLLDAVAVGQITPGPVFTTATFIGYVLVGPIGALTATTGIFLPAFVLVAISGPLVPRLRASPVAAALLDGLNVASLALMAVVTAQLGRAAIVDFRTGLLALCAWAALLIWKLNSSWLVLAGALIGIGLHV